jgi:hypothetical protein
MRANQLIINGVNISPAVFKIINPKKQSKENDYKLMHAQKLFNFFKISK